MGARRYALAGGLCLSANASSYFALAILAAAGMAGVGGCPSDSSGNPLSDSGSNNGTVNNPGTIVAGATDGDGVGGGSPAGDSQGSNTQAVPDGADGNVVTFQDTSVDILLVAETSDDETAVFEITSPSVHGTLGEIQQLTENSAVVTFTPGPGFVGVSEFNYRVQGSEHIAAIVITVYPRIEFTMTPTEGVRPLEVQVTAQAIGDYNLPEGTFTWTFDGESESGSVTTHGTRNHVFTTAGRHTVALSVLLTGMLTPVSCTIAGDLSSERDLGVAYVWPRISGTIRKPNGEPVRSVVVVGTGRSSSSMTDVNGRFQIAVPEGWSGTITPSPLGHSFEPVSRTFSSVNSDIENQDFVDNATPPPTNGQPTANAQSVSMNEDATVSIALSGSDPEGAALRYLITQLPDNGSLVDESNNHNILFFEMPYSLGNGTNRITYRPGDNVNGARSFQFAVHDGTSATNAQSASAAVTVNIAPVNDAPEAQTQTAYTQPNTAVSIRLAGTDIDGDLLNYSIISQPTHGVITGTGANRLYTPSLNYQGNDTFSYRATDPSNLSADGTVTVSVSPWTPPIGVPMPSIGILESHMTYSGQNFAFSTGTAPYPNAGNGPYTHYVDNTHVQATDSSNPYGTPSRPRRSIPENLPAGAVVEVHGGPYAYGPGYIAVNGQGTAQQPIFIRGVGNPRFTQKISVYAGSGMESRYMIFENLDLYKWECLAPAHHIAIRASEVHHGGATGMGGSASRGAISDIVMWNVIVHDNGDWQAEFDQDVHGCTIGAFASSVWILDSTFYHNSGDAVQINASSLSQQQFTHHIYVGRNLSYENKQVGFLTKQSVDTIFSQNTVHTHRPIGASPSAWGAGLGYQYGPERVWMIYNHVYNCSYGISTGSTSGLGFGTEGFFVGNLIHDIHHHPDYAYNPNTAWSNAAFSLVGSPNKYIVNNTMYNCDAGINLPGGVRVYIENNIIANATTANHFHFEDLANLQELVFEHNLLWQPNGTARLRWANPVYTLQQFRTATGKGLTCLEGDPLFVDAANGNLRVQAGSPAVNNGVAHAVYQRFQDLYGLSIAIDPDRVVKPQGGAFDIGSYER